MSPLQTLLRTSRAARPFASCSSAHLHRRTVMTIGKPMYTAHAVARGEGRDGEVKSDDDAGLTLRLGTPKSLGGQGDGNNPEQLFAMGYAACLLTAIQLAAGRLGKTHAASKAAVYADVNIGDAKEHGDYGLSVDIRVEGIEDQEVIDAGHKLCPYSRMLEHGAVVNITKK
ncbi:OsmC-like protein [Peniophora sp. CONT]|nr:OsmC-like protein [Peniophora sp. CONT]